MAVNPTDFEDDEDEDASEPYGGLPALLVEIAEVAGLEAAITLADRYGGNRVYIPRHSPDGHWLSLCVGRMAADHICAHFAHPSGIELELPRGPSMSRSAKQARLRRMIAQGLTSTEITQRLGITRRTVTRNRTSMYLEIDGRQLDMFLAEPAALAKLPPPRGE